MCTPRRAFGSITMIVSLVWDLTFVRSFLFGRKANVVTLPYGIDLVHNLSSLVPALPLPLAALFI